MNSVTLAEFLLARIAEDERIAEEAADSTPFGNWPHWRTDTVLFREVLRDDDTLVADSSEAQHIARWDPARVLAECDAKRRIVELYRSEADVTARTPATGPKTPQEARSGALGKACLLLALPYADHPDYDDAWRP